MNKRKKKTLIWVVVALVVVIAGIFSFGNFGKQKEQTVTVGVVSPSKQDEAVWNQVKKTAKSKYNVDIKLKTFSDYNQPNKALQSGSIDLNAFQHKAFLNAWNKANHGTLVSIGKTFITPIHLYSNNYKSVKSLPDGATIAIILGERTPELVRVMNRPDKAPKRCFLFGFRFLWLYNLAAN